MLYLKLIKNKDVLFSDNLGKNEFSVGKECDINFDIEDKIIFFSKGDKWFFKNETNHTIFYGKRFIRKGKSHSLKRGIIIHIGKSSIEAIKYIPYNLKNDQMVIGKSVKRFDLTAQTETIIGRIKLCDIVISNPQVDESNSKIIFDGKRCYLVDLKSTNGTYLNGIKIKEHELLDYDIIGISGTFFTFFNNSLLYSSSNEGIRIDVRNLSKVVKDSKHSEEIKLLDDISFTINEGEFVAIVGGSGAGKSTILDAINGRRQATSGKVFYDLNEYYSNMNCYQKIIGYVPQKDIMHTDLSVYKTLFYYAEIRMQHELNKQEIHDIVMKCIEDVSLTDKANLKVSRLSGGQKKRVSIAMELLSNPRVIFLDEPTSGLSPDLDYEIMELLRTLSKKQGKTIIVITHNMENVDKCDKIAFLGYGGHLCYYGTNDEIFDFFKVTKYGKIFSLLTNKTNVTRFENKLKKKESYIEMKNEMDRIFGGRK